jgi:hypothetical protein
LSAARKPRSLSGARGDSMNGGTPEPKANDEAFGVFVFAGVRLTCRVGVKKESTAPHVRLGCIHLFDSPP